MIMLGSMADFTLVQLRYFCLVAETGSFSAAGESLRISATAIASAVTALEGSIGAQLCVRRRAHGVRLTTSGQLLYGHARKVLASAENLPLLLAGRGGELVGPLNVGCYSTFAPTLVPGLVETFRTDHPQVALNFSIKSQELLINDLLEGTLDCVFLYDIALPDGLVRKLLYEAPIHVLMSSDNRHAKRDSVALDELQGDPLILFESTPAGPHSFRVLDRLGLSVNVAFRTTEYELVRSMVARNLGYSLMIHKPSADVSYEGRGLVYMPITPSLPAEQVVAVWLEGILPNPRMRELIGAAQRFTGRPDVR